MKYLVFGAIALLAFFMLRKSSTSDRVITPADIAINKASGIDIPLRSTRESTPGGAFSGVKDAMVTSAPIYDIEAAVTLANPEPVGPVTVLSIVEPDGTRSDASGTITPKVTDLISYSRERRGTQSFTAPISFGPVAWATAKTGDLLIRGGVSYVIQKGVNS